MPTIIIRADSSSEIGTGHIMRDLVLANKYKNAKIIFATRNLNGNINDKIIENNYKIEILASNNINEMIKIIKKYRVDMVVIDHYGIKYKDEKKLKKKTGVKILSFDDTYEKHYCDILYNHNISANPKKYKGLVPKHCELRCGSKYTLLRDEFIIEKKKKRKKISKKEKAIFIAIGGADHSNINISILKVLKSFKKLNINLVTTNANKNLVELKKYCKNKKWINLHINSNNIAKLMRKSDFSIVTPSVTVNEVYYLKIPFIAIKTAENQYDIYKYLKKNGFLVIKKFNSDLLKKAIKKILKTTR